MANQDEVTFAQIIDELKPRIEKLYQILGNQRFGYKTTGWELEAKRTELQMVLDRVEVAKQTLADLDERIKAKRSEEDDTTRMIHEQAESYKKKMIQNFEFIQQNKELVEKKLFTKMSEMVK